MAVEIPEARFRLSPSFAIQPDLIVDPGPAKGVIIGQNAARKDFNSIYLGKHAETPHCNVWMDTLGAHVLYVMGKRRSGKSFTLGTIAEGLIADSWIRQGEHQPGVLILDTMNVFLTMPYGISDTHPASAPEVREMAKWKLEPEQLSALLFKPAGTNMPADLPAHKLPLPPSDLGPDEWCGLFEVDPFVDPMGHLLTTLHVKVSTEGYVEKGTNRHVAAQPEFDITDLLSALDKDREIESFARDTRQALRRRLHAVDRTPLFGAAGLDVRRLLTPGRVSILLLRDLDAEMRAVMVALVVKRMMRLRAVSEQQERMVPVHLARAERHGEDGNTKAAEVEREKAQACLDAAAQGLPRSWLIIDEAHNYVPASSRIPSRKPLKKYVDEGRNLGLSIVVATQQPSSLDPSLQRNADMLLIHALSHHDDIVAAQGMINTALPDEITVDNKHRFSGARSFEALVRSLPLGYAIASTDKANRLFPIRVRPRCTIHGGADY